MPLLTRARPLAALCLGLSLLIGCTESEKLYDVSGMVTYEGKPIPKGQIFFDPDASKGTGGMQGFANIIEGKYDTAQEGQGVRGGAYHVRLNAFDGIPGPDAPFGNGLFPEYTGTAELPKQNSTYNLDVPQAK